jgi:hypothetical protein
MELARAQALMDIYSLARQAHMNAGAHTFMTHNLRKSKGIGSNFHCEMCARQMKFSDTEICREQLTFYNNPLLLSLLHA